MIVNEKIVGHRQGGVRLTVDRIFLRGVVDREPACVNGFPVSRGMQ